MSRSVGGCLLQQLRIVSESLEREDGFLHGEYLGVDLPPVEGLLEGGVRRSYLSVHPQTPITAADRSLDVGPPLSGFDLAHGL